MSLQVWEGQSRKIELGKDAVPINTSGLFANEEEIRRTLVDVSPTGQPVYIGDLADVTVRAIDRRMSAKSVQGPIGIAQLSGEAAREGPFAFIGLMAMVSLNLAIINLLPIPILDGGVILMLLIEMFMRRDLSLPVKEVVFKLGFVFLMAIMVFVLYNDITRILPAG